MKSNSQGPGSFASVQPRSSDEAHDSENATDTRVLSDIVVMASCELLWTRWCAN